MLALAVGLALLAAAPASKLIAVQLGGGSEIAETARKQRTTERTVTALRGSIVDRNGAELAISIPTKRLVVDMVELREEGIDGQVDVEQFASWLGDALDVDPGSLSDRLLGARPTNRGVRLIESVDEPVARDAIRHIEERGIRGALYLEASSRRVHPAGDSALRLLGTIGADGPGDRAGVERAFDERLRGTDGRSVVERGQRGQTITGTTRVVEEPSPGSDIRLTLDRTLQHEVESVLLDAATSTGAARAIAVVGIPSTGELLAAGAAERSASTGEVGLSTGPVVLSSAYQAGSVFKLVTVAAAVDAGLADSTRTLSVADQIRVDDRVFSDHERHGVEAMTVTEIVARSSNVGSILLAQELGANRLYDALVGFGFGRPTGIGHPAESSGLLGEVESWTRPDLAASAIGTSQSATAIQIWSAYNVIANGGQYVAPRLVDAVIDRDGSTEFIERPAPRRVISPEAADEVGKMLEAVVTDGTGRVLDLPGFAVAGKTGTSRLLSPERVDPTDAYMWPDGRKRYLAAFAGYLPADRPQVSITVLLEDLPAGMTGGSTAAPVFNELARIAIRELQIAPAGSVGPDHDDRVRARPAAETAS